MRRTLKSLGWFAFGILALVADLVAVLHLPEGQEFLRFSVEKEIGKRFKGQ